MKILFIQGQADDCPSGQGQFAERLAHEKNMEVSCLAWPSPKPQDLISEIKARRPDLLVTIDLAGFEQCTLADNVSYNLLDCKQLHLLLHRNLPNELYLKGQLSISMFFFCAGDAYRDELARRYPRLPWLKKLPGWQEETDRQARESNADSLYEAFREVLQECGLRP